MLRENNNSSILKEKQSKKFDYDIKYSPHISKLAQIQFAQFLNHLLEYSSELTYFAINAFQTSSLRRVQINTLQRFTDFSIPRTCAFYYNLDKEFDNVVQKMRLLCGLGIENGKKLFDNYIYSKLLNLPIIRRSMNVFKCNINRLRDLKEIHQNIGYDLLLPNDQLYLALDLLVIDFDLLNCELDDEIKFGDSMILQTIIKDIFLQFRLVLTWIYPAIKYAAYRPGDPNKEQEVQKCDQNTGITHVDNYCVNKKKTRKRKLIKSSSLRNILSLLHLKNANRNINQNFLKETINQNCSLRNEKKVHNVGRIHLEKSQSNRNIHTIIKNISEINHL
ncbi:hypothetical protein I4U23_008380 [Adineta vaga]|nr:hypothetical protein I4U23_008380 [Adineta vaga]